MSIFITNTRPPHSQICLVWLTVLFLVRPASRQGMFQLGCNMLVAASCAVCLALACVYLTAGILGNSYKNSSTKVVDPGWNRGCLGWRV